MCTFALMPHLLIPLSSFFVLIVAIAMTISTSNHVIFVISDFFISLLLWWWWWTVGGVGAGGGCYLLLLCVADHVAGNCVAVLLFMVLVTGMHLIMLLNWYTMHLFF